MKTLSDLRKEREHWSFSSLQQLLFGCGLQWAAQRYYKIKPEGPISGALVFGTAFHRAIEAVATCLMQDEDVKPSDSEALFDFIIRRQVEEEGAEVNFGKQTLDECSVQGQKMVRCYIENLNPEEKVLAVNEAFLAPLVTADGTVLDKPLLGEADMVIQNGSTVIIDLKTAKARYSDAKVQNDLQATAMILGLQAKYPGVERFRFDVLLKRKTEPAMVRYETRRGEADMYRLASMAQVADSIVKAESFCPNNQSFYCSGCRYKSFCADWGREKTKCITTGGAS